MAQGINSKAVADYLARIRGTNIVPSFGDSSIGGSKDSTTDPEFFARDSDFLSVDFNPLQEEGETEEERKEREEEEERIIEREARQDPTSFTTQTAIESALVTADQTLSNGINARRKVLKSTYGVTRLKDELDRLAMIGFTRTETYQNKASELMAKQAHVDSILNYSNGELSGSEADNYRPDVEYMQKLELNRGRVLREETAREEQEKFETRRDERRKFEAGTRTGRDLQSILVSKNLGDGVVKVVEKIQGTTPTPAQLNSLTQTEDQARFLQKQSTVGSETLAWDISEMAAADKPARAMALKYAKTILPSADYSIMKAQVEEWAAIGDIAADTAELPASQQFGPGGQKAKALAKEHLKRLARENAIKISKQEFTENNFTFEMFNPAFAPIPADEVTIANHIATVLKEEAARRGAATLSDLPSHQREDVKIDTLKRMFQATDKTNQQIIKLYNLVLESGTAAYNEKYGRSLGVIITTQDSIFQGLRF